MQGGSGPDDSVTIENPLHEEGEEGRDLVVAQGVKVAERQGEISAGPAGDLSDAAEDNAEVISGLGKVLRLEGAGNLLAQIYVVSSFFATLTLVRHILTRTQRDNYPHIPYHPISPREPTVRSASLLGVTVISLPAIMTLPPPQRWIRTL